jgi:hypothetical protein
MHRESAAVIDHHHPPLNSYRRELFAYFVTSGEKSDVNRIKGTGRKLFKLHLSMIDKQLLPNRPIGGKKVN